MASPRGYFSLWRPSTSKFNVRAEVLVRNLGWCLWNADSCRIWVTYSHIWLSLYSGSGSHYKSIHRYYIVPAIDLATMCVYLHLVPLGPCEFKSSPPGYALGSFDLLVDVVF